MSRRTPTAAGYPFDAETLEFLARPLLMRMATLGADGYPQVTPVWFMQENGCLYASTEKERIKYRNIVRDPRVGASIDDDHPYRGISIKGVAHIQQGDIEERVRRIVTRYVPPDELGALMAWLFKGPRVVIEIRPISVVKIGAEWHTL
ncbi:MAG: TIGR03618 family F420-dependent PPOX class oxidoreductase [Chloroflexi bacterium]|nr:TIGR03618 family F420-dependent PPOX class oxidoreductase [Chloroflexota bacterium]